MLVHLALSLTYDLDFQSHVCYGHDPHTHTNSSSTVSRFKRYSGKNGRTDGRQIAVIDGFTFDQA